MALSYVLPYLCIRKSEVEPAKLTFRVVILPRTRGATSNFQFLSFLRTSTSTSAAPKRKSRQEARRCWFYDFSERQLNEQTPPGLRHRATFRDELIDQNPGLQLVVIARQMLTLTIGEIGFANACCGILIENTQRRRTG